MSKKKQLSPCMMMAATSISATLTDSLSSVGSPSIGERAQFEGALAQAAASMTNDIAPGPARAAPVPPPLDIQRAAAQTSSLGDHLLQTISSMYRDKTATSDAPDHEVGLVKGALPAPAQNLPVGSGAVGTRMSGVPRRDDFEAMIAGLRDVYNSVTLVALLSKGVSGVTSSVNKLIKEG